MEKDKGLRYIFCIEGIVVYLNVDVNGKEGKIDDILREEVILGEKFLNERKGIGFSI